ncbi:MAG: hypothetical protein KJZ69_12830 [Phycisphaerales bacterium]|nr:hypothetical protein [Phycisphaerales bacterium]
MRIMILTLALLAGAPGCDNDADQWWKGNTHTHTLWSDGDAAPELAAAWYRDNGYHFLVLSDHNILSRDEKWFPILDLPRSRLTSERVDDLIARFGAERVDTREVEGQREMRLRTLDELREDFEQPGAFIFIEGEEITDSFNRLPVHVNGLNLAELVKPQGGESVLDVMQRNLDAVIAHGHSHDRTTLAHVNHPNFGWGVSVEDIARLRGEQFFEIYNGHRSVRNHGDADHPGTEQMWDIALTRRLTELNLGPLYGLATDDAHNYHEVPEGHSNPGRGWIMVRAESLDAEAILNAMHRGDFYASSGVVLDAIESDDHHLTIHIRAEPDVAYTTRFLGTRRVGDADGDGQPDLGIVGEILDETMANPATYTFAGDEVYVRAVIISSKVHPNPFAKGDREMAWVQPVVIHGQAGDSTSP